VGRTRRFLQQEVIVLDFEGVVVTLFAGDLRSFVRRDVRDLV
jgi:hypothetical protein